MAQQVIKSDKTRQPYCEEKIFEAVFLASSEAGLSYEKATQLGNGEKARLDRTKISNWVQWSARGLEDQIEIEHELLSDLVPLLTEGITTEDIHQMLITACLAKEDIRYSRIAANLEAATIMKSRKHKLGIFETDSFSEILDVMVSEGLWSGDWVTSLTDFDLRR